MSRRGQDFIGLVPPKDSRPKANYFNGASGHALFRDQLTISSWLCLGAAVQGILVLFGGRLALLPAVAVLLYRTTDAYLMATGWKRNIYMDDIIANKISAQIPDELGNYGTRPANADITVLLIGIRCNHPLGVLAPGFKNMGDYFQSMTEALEAHAEDFGFLGMTSWINTTDRTTRSELMSVGYFRTPKGLHNFAHSEHHRVGWKWWNDTVKDHPYLSIYHEVYHAPEGHWEGIAMNTHLSGINSTTFKFTDKETGEERWASPVVDASKGLLKTSAGRMSRSQGEDHDKFGADPYDVTKT